MGSESDALSYPKKYHNHKCHFLSGHGGIVIQENWILQFTAFLANFKWLRQAQTRASSTGAGTNRPQLALNGTYQLRPAATGYNRHNTGPDRPRL